jgi:hypothetical protein
MSRDGVVVSIVSGCSTGDATGCETIETSRDIASKHRTPKSLADVARSGALHGD